MDEMMKAQIMDICRDKASCNMTFEAGRAVVIETITVIAAAVALACFFEYMARRPVKSTDDHSGGADVG